MKSFWNALPRPFFAMAPMKDVTDAAFRALIARRSRPDIFWTEFVSADGLYHTREIQKMKDEENPLMRDLVFDREKERPIVAQIFSSKPKMIAYAVKLIEKLEFNGVDLNMGCPDRAIEKQGCGSAMIKTPKIACEIIQIAKVSSNLPVSVKTRVGYNEESLEEWLPVLLEAGPSAITIHLRTRKELSLAPANWELMKKAVEIRNRVNPNVLLIGNGDVQNRVEGDRLAEEAGCDGVMIGRGMFGNPWVFEKPLNLGRRTSPSEVGRPTSKHRLDEKLDALLELAHEFEKLSPPKHFDLLKKHIKAFVAGFDGAAALRAKLMESKNAADLERFIKLGHPVF